MCMLKDALELAKNAYDLGYYSPTLSAAYGWLLVHKGQA